MKSLVLLLTSVFMWYMAYNAVSSTYSRYIKEVFGIEGGGFASGLIVGTIAAVICYIPIGFFSGSLGRKKTINIGICAMLFAFILASFLTEYNFLIYVVLILVGFGWAAINVNSYPMVVEMATGNNIGKYTGYYYTFSMAAQIITPIFSGILIDNLDISYRVLFPYATIFIVIALITMSFVKHGDSKPIKKSSVLENLDY